MAPKAPRFSMVDPDQLQMINETKPKAVARKWGENSQFQMEEVSLEEEASPIPMVKEFSAFPKPRKYSDNACAKKPPSFLTSPRGPDTRIKTPRAKFSIDRFIILK